ncbi:MAG TPA: DUF3592 domain-containing protein [Pseudonocardiaceae bacterium]
MTTGGLTAVAEAQEDTSAGPVRPGRVRRAVAVSVLVVASVFSGLCLLLLAACWQDDAAIDAHLGRTTADVLSTSFSQAAVRFLTPDGTVNIPDTGVLYPEGLVAGERVRIEYDTQNPQLARIAGRDYTLAFLPVGMAIGITWAAAVPLVWWLRRGQHGHRQRT